MAVPKRTEQSPGKVKGPEIWTEEKIRELGDDLLEFVAKPEVIHFCEWAESRKRLDTYFHRLGDKYELWAEYMERARRILASKLLKKAAENKGIWVANRYVADWMGERKTDMDKLREETRIKAEATKEAINSDPNHPFWGQLQPYMEAAKKRLASKDDNDTNEQSDG